MSHSSTKIYTDSSHGISIDDVQSVINRDEHDIGGLAVEGASNGDVNKWSKYKFVRSSSLAGPTAAELEEMYYGLSISKYTSLSALAGSYSTSSDYSYLAPRGLAHSEWFRFLDTDEHINNAECPVDSFTGASSSANVYEGDDLIVRLYLNPTPPAGSILLSDLKPGGDKALSNYYFGVVIRTGTGSTYRIITQDSVVGDGSQAHQELSLTLASSLFTVGNDYTLYPVFSYNAITSVATGGSYPSGLYKIPGVSTNSFHVYPISAAVSVAIKENGFSAWMSGAKVAYSLTGVYQSNRGSTTGEILYTIYSGQDTTGTKLIDNQRFYYGSIPVPPPGESTQTGQFNITNPGYLTAELSYQGSASLPVTVAVADEPPE